MKTQVDIDETLAVILSDLKKLVKHFKLDRRKQGEEDNHVETEPTPDNGMLQEISRAVKDISERKSFTNEQYTEMEKIVTAAGRYFFKDQDEHHAELKSLLEVIAGKLDKRTTESQNSTIRHDHTYTVDFRNSKAALTIITMAIVILISVGINIHQADRNSDLMDNNVKYRYIKMQGKASADDIYRLECIYTFERNKDSIRMIRNQVDHYERLLKEYNEKQLQIRLNDARAKQIEKEAATVKGNK